MLPMSVPHGVQPPSTLANDYPGGYLFSTYIASDGTQTNEPQVWLRLYNATGAATVKGRPYMVTYSGDGAKLIQAATPAAVTADAIVVFAKDVVADATFGFFVRAGVAEILVEGTTDVAVGDFLKIVAGTTTTAVIKDGTTKSTDSVAIAMAAQTANSEVLTKCLILGERADLD